MIYFVIEVMIERERVGIFFRYGIIGSRLWYGVFIKMFMII